MVAFHHLLALLPLAAALPSQSASTPLVGRHCLQPKNCGAVVQGTACDFCCAANVKPDAGEVHCKSRNKACENGGTVFNCDAD